MIKISVSFIVISESCRAVHQAGQLDRYTDRPGWPAAGQIYRQTAGRAAGQIYRQTAGRAAGQIYRQAAGRAAGQILLESQETLLGSLSHTALSYDKHSTHLSSTRTNVLPIEVRQKNTESYILLEYFEI